VHHESDDQERSERKLAEGDRGADCQPLAEVVQPDPGRHERRQRDALERRAPLASGRGREALRDERQPEVACGDAEQDQPGTLKAARKAGLQVERLGERVDREEAQQPRRQRHEARHPARAAAAQRRQPAEAQRHRYDSDEQADHRIAQEPARRCTSGLDRGGDVEGRLDPARARHADGVGVVLDPLERDDDRARAQPAERCGPVDGVRHDRVVHHDGRDGQLLPLRVRNANPDRAGLELDPSNVEPIGRRRRAADEVEQRRPARREDRHRADEQQERQQRPQAPAAGELVRRRVHQSTTSKNPIQPSSVNSDWWAWNMNRPAWAKSISMIPRWPWQSITVSVYSKWSLEPVG
jgi:hypothetical protein